jgi:oxalate decarboxylase
MPAVDLFVTVRAQVSSAPNPEPERQDPFTVRPPSSDHGTMPNLKWSFAAATSGSKKGRWA